MTFLGYVFVSVSKNSVFANVKNTLVFIVYSPRCFAKSRLKNHHFFENRTSDFLDPPFSKMLIFHYTYAKFTSQKSVFGGFRGGARRGPEAFRKNSIFERFKRGDFTLFNENVDISLDVCTFVVHLVLQV